MQTQIKKLEEEIRVLKMSLNVNSGRNFTPSAIPNSKCNFALSQTEEVV